MIEAQYDPVQAWADDLMKHYDLRWSEEVWAFDMQRGWQRHGPPAPPFALDLVVVPILPTSDQRMVASDHLALLTPLNAADVLQKSEMPPPKLSSDIESDIREFVADWRQEQREGYTLKALGQAQQRMFDAFEEHKKATADALAEARGRIAELGFRIGSVEGAIPELKERLGALEEKTIEISEDSKVHRIDLLEKALAERDAALARVKQEKREEVREVKKEKRYWVRYLVGGAIGVVFAVAATLIVNALAGHHAAEPTHVDMPEK
jgi:hypothetical protein